MSSPKEVGSQAPDLSGIDALGARRTIGYQEGRRPTLVYTFSKDCPHCERNWRAMRSFQPLSPKKLRIAYIDTLDQLSPEYLAANGMNGSVVLARLTPESALAYGARLTPQLELLNADGKVEWSRVGEINRRDVQDALKTIADDQPEKEKLK